MTMMTTTTHIVFLSLGDLDEHGHQLVELVKGDDLGGGWGGEGFFNTLSPSHLVSVLVEEIEDAGQVVLHLARAEQVEQDQHVRHCCRWNVKILHKHFGCSRH